MIDADRFWDADVECMSRDRLDALQEEKLLGEVLPWAYERAPLIRAVWDDAGVTPADIGSMADFRALAPFVDKDAMRRYRDRHADPYGGMLAIDLATPGVFGAIFSTSGTTGDPTLAPFAGREGPTILAREFWEMGVRPGDTFVEMLFTYRGPAIHWTIRGIGATPIFVDHDPAELPRLVELSRRFRPTGWYNLSGPLIVAIEELAATTGVDPAEAFESYRGIVFAGEPLGPRARRLAEAWGMELFDHTGVGDVGAATECREHDGCHVWEDMALVDVLDPDGDRPVPDGERGELVSTTLVNLVSPLVRYRSDDLVRLTREPCRCGRTHARVWPLGRKGDEIVVDGRSVLPVDVWPAIEAVPETQAGLFQIVRPAREVDRLHLRVGYARAGTGGLGALRDRVADAVHAELGVAAQVELVEQEVLLRQGPPHKIPRVVKR
jgi:phenylacetate-CoA ligase